MQSLIIALILFLTSPTAAAQEQPPYYAEGWLKINQYSPVEGFESHGSFGWHLGIGLIQTAADPEEAKTNAAPTQIPRLFLTHGTSWPVDFGVSLARLDADQGRQIGAHVQWTLFERFQQPAVAIRIARMQVDGISSLDRLQSDSALLGISYGFLRYFNFGLGMGQQKHRFETKPAAEDNLFGLKAGWREEVLKTESIWTICLKVHPFTPFANVGIERIYTHPRKALTVAKFSYML